MKHRTTPALLAVAVALLSVDLALRLSPQEAAAQEPEFRIFPEPPVPEPKVVSVTSEQIWFGSGSSVGTTSRWKIIRAWSDGQVDAATVYFNTAFNPDVAEVSPPVVIIPAD